MRLPDHVYKKINSITPVEEVRLLYEYNMIDFATAYDKTLELVEDGNKEAVLYLKELKGIETLSSWQDSHRGLSVKHNPDACIIYSANLLAQAQSAYKVNTAK